MKERKAPKKAIYDGEMVRMPPEAIEWLRWACTSDEYWSLYFFCKVILGYKDLIPEVHLLYCEFLDSKDSNYKLAMMPRDFVKSWILYAKAIRDYLRDHDRRMLLAMSTEDNARKASEYIANVFTKNKLLRMLFPEAVPNTEDKDRWEVKARTLPRHTDAPEPTFTFAGVKTELVSGHYDDIFLDDIFAKEASESPDIAARVFSMVAACEALRNDPKTSGIIHTCTRWSMDDVAARIIGFDKQQTDEKIFRAEGDSRYICLKRSVVEDGQPIWPQKFPNEELAKLEKGYEAQGVGYFFAFQHMNNPIDARVVEFPTPRHWERDDKGNIILLQPDGKEPIVIREKDLFLTMTIDPGYKEKKKNDDSAICVIGSHPAGYRINLFSWNGKLSPQKMIRQIVNVVNDFESKGRPLAAVGMETNSTQVAFQQWIKETANAMGVYIPWRPIKTSTQKSKHSRIRQMISCVADGYYYTHHKFVSANNEMRMFPASRRDNWLDAFAYQPQLWGVASREEEVDEEQSVPWARSIREGHPEDLYGRREPEEVEGYGG